MVPAISSILSTLQLKVNVFSFAFVRILPASTIQRGTQKTDFYFVGVVTIACGPASIEGGAAMVYEVVKQIKYFNPLSSK